MKVCDVVLNSIWYDPRVRKQIAEYLNNGVELVCVGTKCARYNEEKVAEIPCKVVLHKETPKGKGRIGKAFGKLDVIKKIAETLIKEKPDVIHANDLYALYPAYLAKRKIKCKIVYDAHEINSDNIGTSKIEGIIFKASEKYLTRHKVDRMVSVSNAAAGYFEKEYSIKKPLVVTNCSIKAEQYISDTKNDGFEILNHGLFYKGRGYDIMIESIKYLKEYDEIKLALRGMGVMEEELKARAKELGDENIRFYPPIHVSKLIPEASASHIGVAITEQISLNFKYSVSNKLFEYASAGLPVIMSAIPEHIYLNDKYNFGIVLPEDSPEEFAKAAIKIYTDKELYKQLSENAIKMSNELNWENEFAKLINEEKELLK